MRSVILVDSFIDALKLNRFEIKKKQIKFKQNIYKRKYP